MLKRQNPLKVIIIAVSLVVLSAVICMIGWNIFNFYRLKSSLQDVYFMEYVNGTTIYKYDVSKRKTVTVAELEGGRYSKCKINRIENYIIGEFWDYEEDTTVLLRYNLSDDTAVELTGIEPEVIKEAEDKLPERSSLPEEVKKIVTNGFISWSEDGEKAAFSGSNQEKIYLYNANTGTCECVLEAGWNQTFGNNLGLDASGNYLFYKNNFNYLFQTADVTIMIYDLQTGEKIEIYKERYTQHSFEFVQDLSKKEIARMHILLK